MIDFYIDIDTRNLTAEQEDYLIAELESVIKFYSWWSEFYQGDLTVDYIQLPTCTDDFSPYGQIIVYGETTEEKLNEIYNIIDDFNVTFKDNDPLGIEFDKKLIGIMKASVKTA